MEAKRANKKSGKYVFAVEPGNYILTVTSPDYQPYSQEIVIHDKSESDYVFEIEKNVVMKKFEPAQTADKKEEERP